MALQKLPQKFRLLQVTFANGWVPIWRYSSVYRRKSEFCEGDRWLTPVSCSVAPQDPEALLRLGAWAKAQGKLTQQTIDQKIASLVGKKNT